MMQVSITGRLPVFFVLVICCAWRFSSSRHHTYTYTNFDICALLLPPSIERDKKNACCLLSIPLLLSFLVLDILNTLYLSVISYQSSLFHRFIANSGWSFLFFIIPFPLTFEFRYSLTTTSFLPSEGYSFLPFSDVDSPHHIISSSHSEYLKSPLLSLFKYLAC